MDDSESKKGPKADKEPEVPVTVTGIVKQSTDGQGRPSFTLDRRRDDLGAVGRPAVVLGRQEPARGVRRQVGHGGR